MRMIILTCCLCAHALCAFLLYFAPGPYQNTYAIDPVLLGVALYFAWRMSRDGLDGKRLHFYAAGAFIPAAFVVLCDLLSLSGSLVFVWMNTWAHPGVQVQEALWKQIAVTVVAVLSVVNFASLVSLYRNKRKSLPPKEGMGEEQRMKVGGLQVSLATSLWLNLGLTLLSITVIVAAGLWVKIGKDDMRRESRIREGDSIQAVILLSWGLARSDYESGDAKILVIEGTKSPSQTQTGEDVPVRTIKIPWKVEEKAHTKVFEQFVEAYNLKMRDLVKTPVVE